MTNLEKVREALERLAKADERAKPYAVECLTAAALSALSAHEQEVAELARALDKLLPYLSTESELLDNASLNEGRASGYDTASVKVRKALAKVKE